MPFAVALTANEVWQRTRLLRQALDADADETGTRVDDERRRYLALDRQAEVRQLRLQGRSISSASAFAAPCITVMLYSLAPAANSTAFWSANCSDFLRPLVFATV